MDNIVLLGNGTLTRTFQEHYQRDQMAIVGFTFTVLSSSTKAKFFDARDSLD
jgi:hypothetical protein